MNTNVMLMIDPIVCESHRKQKTVTPHLATVEPCADVILSAAARRVILTGGGGGAPIDFFSAAAAFGGVGVE